MRHQLGVSWATALHHRTRVFRAALQAHWDITHKLGRHQAQAQDALKAARLVGALSEYKDYEEMFRESNWSKHSPPPGTCSMPTGPQGYIKASVLEAFRETTLYNRVMVEGWDRSSAESSLRAAPVCEEGWDQKLSESSQCAAPERHDPPPSSAACQEVLLFEDLEDKPPTQEEDDYDAFRNQWVDPSHLEEDPSEALDEEEDNPYLYGPDDERITVTGLRRMRAQQKLRRQFSRAVKPRRIQKDRAWTRRRAHKECAKVDSWINRAEHLESLRNSGMQRMLSDLEDLLFDSNAPWNLESVVQQYYQLQDDVMAWMQRRFDLRIRVVMAGW